MTPSWRIWVSWVFLPMCSAFLFSLPSLEGLDTRLKNNSRGSVLRAMTHLRGTVVEIGNFLLFHESSWLICFSNPRSTAIHDIALATITWEYQWIWRLGLKTHNEKHFNKMILEISQVNQAQWHAFGPSYSGVWGSFGIQVQPGWRSETTIHTKEKGEKRQREKESRGGGSLPRTASSNPEKPDVSSCFTSSFHITSFQLEEGMVVTLSPSPFQITM